MPKIALFFLLSKFHIGDKGEGFQTLTTEINEGDQGINFEKTRKMQRTPPARPLIQGGAGRQPRGPEIFLDFSTSKMPYNARKILKFNSLATGELAK